MSLLRNLRNLAVLVILTVGSLGLTPQPALARGCPSVGCGTNLTGCHPCGGRCVSCYDRDLHAQCGWCRFRRG